LLVSFCEFFAPRSLYQLLHPPASDWHLPFPTVDTSCGGRGDVYSHRNKNMTGLVMHSLHTSLEIERWDQLHFILWCFKMQQPKIYPSRWKSKVLTTKNRDKLISHLLVAHRHFCKKNTKLFH
jgi:hypothetical protein